MVAAAHAARQIARLPWKHATRSKVPSIAPRPIAPLSLSTLQLPQPGHFEAFSSRLSIEHADLSRHHLLLLHPAVHSPYPITSPEASTCQSSPSARQSHLLPLADFAGTMPAMEVYECVCGAEASGDGLVVGSEVSDWR